MPAQTWEALINAYQTNQASTGAALANSAVLTDVSPGGNTAGQMLVLPANWAIPGQQLRFTAHGIYSTTGSPTLSLGLYYGAVAGTALATTGPVTAATAATNQVFILEAISRVVSTGTSGAILTVGKVIGMAATPSTPTLLPATSASGGSATINTSTANGLTLGAQWGTASASNTLTVFSWAVELLN